MLTVVPFRLQQCFGPFTMLPLKGSIETVLFRHISDHVFRSPYFRKYISYEGHVFWGNVQNLMHIPKMQKNEKDLFVF